MKKLILLIVALVGITIAQAQTVSIPAPTVAGTTYQVAPTTYNVTNTLGRTFKWSLPLAWPATQSYTVKMDSISGNHTAMVVTLWGQTSAVKGDSTSIATKTWYGTRLQGSPDTTITLANTTANRYIKYYVTFKGTGTGVTRVTSQELKLFNSGQ